MELEVVDGKGVGLDNVRQEEDGDDNVQRQRQRQQQQQGRCVSCYQLFGNSLRTPEEGRSYRVSEEWDRFF